jgi:hypothetical protein
MVGELFVGKPEGREHSDDLSIAGKVILKWILDKLYLRLE